MCQRVNPGAFVAGNAAGNATNVVKKIVYKVASVSANVCTVTNISYNNLEIPVAGDDFVRIGNTGTASRQSVMYLTSDDTNAPFIDMKADVNSYADWHAEGSTKLRLGRLDGLTAGGTNEYGLWAGPSTTNYIKAGSGGVFLKGSEATYLKATANTIEFFDTNRKMDITGDSIKMFANDGSTVMTEWDHTTLTLGGTTGATDNCVAISSSGVKIYDNAQEYIDIHSTGMDIYHNNYKAAIFGTTTVIGSNTAVTTSSTDSCIRIDSNGVKIFEDAGDYIDINSSGTDVYVATNKTAIFGATTVIGGGTAVTTSSTDDCVRIDSNGVKVFQDSGTYVSLTTAGLTIFNDGTVADPGTGVAHYGTTARVGPHDASKTAFRVANDGTASIGTSGTKKITMSTAGVLTVADILLTGKITLTGTGTQNVCIGTGNADAGSDNIAIGVNAGANYDSNNQQNVAIGTEALQDVGTAGASLTGLGNVAIGWKAGKEISSGVNNICIGGQSGASGSADLTTGGSNIFIGQQAIASAGDASNQIVIGTSVQSKGDNTAVFGGSSTTDVWLSYDAGATVHCGPIDAGSSKIDTSGEVECGTLDVNGNATISGNLDIEGDILMSNGDYIGINGAERIVFDSAGSVEVQGADFGINCDPGYRFDCIETDADNTNYMARFWNDGGNDDSHGIIIQCGHDEGAEASDPDHDSPVLIRFNDGSGDPYGFIVGKEADTVSDSGTSLYISDIRLKKDIVDTTFQGLDTLNKIKLRDFIWKTDGKKIECGLISQEVNEVYPPAGRKRKNQINTNTGEMIHKDYIDDGYLWTVSNEALILPLVKAVQELSAKVTALEAQI